MKLKQRQPLTRLIGVAALTLLQCGCVAGRAGFGPGAQQTVLVAPAPTAEEATREAVVADMRAQAESADERPYPTAFQAEQTARLAGRPEPRSVQEVAAIATELALLAERRASTNDPQELAALDARARELKRLFAEAQAGEVRR